MIFDASTVTGFRCPRCGKNLGCFPSGTHVCGMPALRGAEDAQTGLYVGGAIGLALAAGVGGFIGYLVGSPHEDDFGTSADHRLLYTTVGAAAGMLVLGPLVGSFGAVFGGAAGKAAG